MADGHDRFDSDERGGDFLMGLLAGAVVGVGLGMLFAPKAGSELRNQLSEQAGTLANQARDGYRKVTADAAQWAERGKDVYANAREAVSRGTEEAQQYIRDAADTAAGDGHGSRRS